MRALVIACLAGAIACNRPRSTIATCLRYGPDTVRVSGTLQRLTFPGPPNYEDVQTGDEPETGFYLAPAVPLCAAGGRDEVDGGPRADVRLVQLVLDSAGYAALRPALGRAVALRGTLFPSHTGHHHAPVLLDVLRPASAEAP